MADLIDMPESEISRSPSSQSKPDSHADASLTPAGAIIREFFVDFLGSLVPGLFFVSFSTPLLLWLLWLFRESIILLNGLPLGLAQMDLVTALRIELACAVLVLAYVLGSVFHRQDPKVPDQESAAHVLANITDFNEVKRLVIQPPKTEWEQIEKELRERPFGEKLFTKEQATKWATSEGGQYPYSHLSQYLERRGLHHLAKYVKWDWTAKTANEEAERDIRDIRSKMFINVLKIRLQYCVPEKCGEIIRNEAHVRMMSSVWYACKALQKLFLCVVATALIPMLAIWLKTRNWRMLISWAMQVLILALLSAAPAKLLRLRIKKFIHYQRVREIVFVLEAAWFAEKKGQLDILSELPGDLSAKAAAGSSS